MFVALAADLGCRYISTALTSNPYTPSIYPPFSLRDDPALRREMTAAMRDLDVSISLGEGMVVRAGADIQDRVADLEIMAELGVRRINTVSLDPDLDRSIDQFGILAENAASLGMETTVEPSPGLTIPDLPSALDVIRQVGRPEFRLLVDTMHVVRSGSGPDDLARLDPGVIGYIQLSDAPLAPAIPDYMEEAMFERMVPGTGELPLLDVLEVLPRDLVIGLEIPLRAEAMAGVGPHERVGRCVDAARGLLARLADQPHQA
ncbi:sugar phosphate isomerase/epimerase [Streptomyces mirabilis]|uniref:sugar phosphate isomerase/epimerase family protein n=1 Tax=Streptomyces mirabilis TaxID=68239 RepID=UPI0021C03B4D|nr:sugar phosphate isomerase/epimerase [Streptomyces mirabilis]MCT9108682.1 sugar phosphate isomerase/epimerase [Streptomyces mirabilis]